MVLVGPPGPFVDGYFISSTSLTNNRSCGSRDDQTCDDGAAGANSAPQTEEQDLDDHRMFPAFDWGIVADPGAGLRDADLRPVLSWDWPRFDPARLFKRGIPGGFT